MSISPTVKLKSMWFHFPWPLRVFRNKQNVRGQSDAQATGWGGDSSLGTYLDSFASIWINSHTSPPIGVATASGSTRPTPGCPLGFGLMKDRARWVRKMRSVSPRMRNMRGMGAGMKWTQWTELNGAGWEGLASPWMDEVEWKMGGWVEREREWVRGKGPDCKGCVHQQKKRVERPNSIQWRRRMGRDKNMGCSAWTSSWQPICSNNTVTSLWHSVHLKLFSILREIQCETKLVHKRYDEAKESHNQLKKKKTANNPLNIPAGCDLT